MNKPPAAMVPSLMESLFSWMRQERTALHPLILSCVFHYAFVFIHPFSDGNGRIARLWQTLLLSAWNPMFQYIPLESQIEVFQEEYYQAISTCHREGSSTGFIEFMLERIDRVLDSVIEQGKHLSCRSEQVDRLVRAMDYDTPYTAKELLQMLGLKSKEALRRNYLDPAIEDGLIVRTIPEKPTSRNQRYRKV